MPPVGERLPASKPRTPRKGRDTDRGLHGVPGAPRRAGKRRIRTLAISAAGVSR